MCSPRIFHNHLNTNVSSSFIITAVRDIGLKSLSICLRGVTLGMRETFADFHMLFSCSARKAWTQHNSTNGNKTNLTIYNNILNGKKYFHYCLRMEQML